MYMCSSYAMHPGKFIFLSQVPIAKKPFNQPGRLAKWLF